MTETAQQILVAGIGNAWLRDDGFGGEVAKLLSERELPPGVHVIDFGSGGLDLAYEVMRGYDALILIDVSRQGGTAGTLYVMEADPDDVEGKIEDGQMLDPHGMDPQTVLRFVKYVGGWPGRVFVVACEPEVVEDVGFGLSESVSRSLERAADVVLETVEDLRARAGMIADLCGHPAALDATRDAQRARGTPALACDAQHSRSDHPIPALIPARTAGRDA
jgi:hydrogenase maturation protease